ncbi:hypothetical protein [Megalodesulfovibrio paquesii]
MSVFKKEKEFKRVIFNIDAELAERLEKAKDQSRRFGKKLDVDSAMDKALEKFLKKAEKKLEEMSLEPDKHPARGLCAEEEGPASQGDVGDSGEAGGIAAATPSIVVAK